MEFQEQKEKQLERKDKSNEQKWDASIERLCNKINSKKEYCTTSSCGGRITLIKGLKEKSRNVFLFKTHEKITLGELKKALENPGYDKLIYFKQETCILHVACSSMESARVLLNKAKLVGWKKSGIISVEKRVILEMMGTEKLEFPIMNNFKLLVSEDFLKLIVKEANSRLERVWEKIQKLEKLI